MITFLSTRTYKLFIKIIKAQTFVIKYSFTLKLILKTIIIRKQDAF